MISDVYLTAKLLILLMLPGIPYVMILMDHRKLDIVEKIALSYGFSFSLISLMLFWMNVFIGIKISLISAIFVYIVVLSTPLTLFLIQRMHSDREKINALDLRYFFKTSLNTGIVFSIIILLFIILIKYYGLLTYGYIVPPGDDVFGHIARVSSILETGNILGQEEWYPAGFHSLVAILSYITNESPLTIVKYFYPFLVPLSTMAIYTFIKEGYGEYAAIFGLIISIFSTSPQLTINDGGYPNVIGTYFILILSFTLMAKSLESKSFKYSLIGGLFFSSLSLYHILSFVEGVVILFVMVLALFSADLLRKKRVGSDVKIILVFVGVFLILGLYPSMTFLPDIMYTKFVDPSVQPTQHISPLSLYPQNMGEIAFYFGCLGFIFSPLMLRKRKYFTILLITWIAVTFFMTRTTYFFFPQRFIRELGAPLILFSGIFYYGLNHILGELKHIKILYKNRIHFSIIKYKNKICQFKKGRTLVSIIIGVILLTLLPTNMNYIFDNFAYNQMVRVGEIDYETIFWLKRNSDALAAILASPYTDYLKVFLSNEIIVSWPVLETVTQFSPLKNYTFAFYNPNTLTGMQIINHKNYTLWRMPNIQKIVPIDIRLIYAGRKPDGWVHPSSRWDYNKEFMRTLYLEPIHSAGGITIYRVRQDLLKELINSFHNQTSLLIPCETLEGVHMEGSFLRLSNFAKEGNYSIEALINTTLKDLQVIKFSSQRTWDFEQIKYLSFWFSSTQSIDAEVWIEDEEHNFMRWDFNYETPLKWKNIVLAINEPHLTSEKPINLSNVKRIGIDFEVPKEFDSPITFWIDDISIYAPYTKMSGHS